MVMLMQRLCLILMEAETKLAGKKDLDLKTNTKAREEGKEIEDNGEKLKTTNLIKEVTGVHLKTLWEELI